MHAARLNCLGVVPDKVANDEKKPNPFPKIPLQGQGRVPFRLVLP